MGCCPIAGQLQRYQYFRGSGRWTNGILQFHVDLFEARYPAMTEWKSIELSRGAYISERNRGIGDRGKNPDDSINQIPAQISSLRLFPTVAFSVFLYLPPSPPFLPFSSSLHLLKTRLSSLCISRVLDRRLRQRTNASGIFCSFRLHARHASRYQRTQMELHWKISWREARRRTIERRPHIR